MSGKVDYDFTIEYAKSSRSTCRTTKEKIMKGEMRIGKMVQSPHFDGKIPQWHKYDHFFAKGNKGLDQWEMLHGRDSLRPDDVDEVRKLIEKHGSGSASKPTTAKKRKATGGPKQGSAKKAKLESKEDLAYKAQSTARWELKDKLSSAFDNKSLREILELNGSSIRGGEAVLLDRVSDGMMFGVKQDCPNDCDNGRLYFDKPSGMYRCSGHADAWAKCLFQAETITTTPWKLPDFATETDEFKDWKYKKQKRVVLAHEIVRAALSEKTALAEGRTEELKAIRAARLFHQVGNKTTTPLAGTVVAVAGKLSVTQAIMKKTVAELGGKFQAKVTNVVTHLISTKATVKKKGEKKVAAALELDIPILSEDWVDESGKGAFVDQSLYLIGGSKKAKEKLKREFTDPKTEELKEAAKAEKKVKIVMKGRAAIDPVAGQKMMDDYHVLDLGGRNLYTVTLNVADATTNINSYYGLQVLASDRGNDHKLFRKWGRVGTSFGNHKLEDFGRSKAAAIKKFEELFYEKTFNSWDDRESFVKKAGKFFPVDIDYSNVGKDDGGESLKKLKAAQKTKDTKSKLDKRVQDLVSLIFDIEVMEESLKEMEIDLDKMPLGQLSQKQINAGYAVLKEVEAALKKADGSKKDGELLGLSNKFYTLIPHDFGGGEVKIISTVDALTDKLTLMSALTDIEIAHKLLSEATTGDSRIDSEFAKLKSKVTPLEKEDESFQTIKTYFDNQKQKFSHYAIEDIFEINRDGSEEAFKASSHLDNRQLLWHGSRLSNYVGILSQGLRIAPPEAPRAGHRFGKGVYCADIAEKSLTYCYSGGTNYILIMLIETVLGKEKQFFQDKYMEKPARGYDSTKAMGWVKPKNQTELNGITVPWGPPTKTGISSSCTHNEYVVYNTNQCCIRYLLKVKIR
eukprot:TRINITY_DN2246_c0_g1_i2.p1 TRINITY_DN2246_c0_g1~~TRINITY_DN2246_c0_g1_i2.p1  ORF type:complete len:909 (+),score=271.63 TRINITY_DN2246_c0_g1_i2:126-2852(+)